MASEHVQMRIALTLCVLSIIGKMRLLKSNSIEGSFAIGSLDSFIAHLLYGNLDDVCYCCDVFVCQHRGRQQKTDPGWILAC